MTQAQDTLTNTATGADPVLLAVLLVIFVVGALVPIGAVVLSSLRESARARQTPEIVENPVAANLVAAVEMVDVVEPPVDLAEPANDTPDVTTDDGAATARLNGHTV
jgi:hypothetical protein